MAELNLIQVKNDGCEGCLGGSQPSGDGGEDTLRSVATRGLVGEGEEDGQGEDPGRDDVEDGFGRVQLRYVATELDTT